MHNLLNLLVDSHEQVFALVSTYYGANFIVYLAGAKCFLVQRQKVFARTVPDGWQMGGVAKKKSSTQKLGGTLQGYKGLT